MTSKGSWQGAATALIIPLVVLGSACSSASSGWNIEKKEDAMTDAVATVATMRLSGKIADVEVAAFCGKRGESYSFSVFDKEGQPLGFSDTQTAQFPIKHLLLRLDQSAPVQVYDGSRYANRFDLYPPRSGGAGSAQQIVVRMPLIGGIETFTIDQDDAAFREMMAPCIRQREAAKQRLVRESAAQTRIAPVPAVPVTQPTAQAASDCWRPPSGPNVIDDPDRAITMAEIEEIQNATGREYVQGDTIWGRAEDRCPV